MNLTLLPLPQRDRGFTLMELMVVTVIVAGLSAAGFAVWRSASLRARQSVCQGNLRNIGVALHLHAQENGGAFPLTTHSTTLDRAWIYSLEEHLGRFDETRICPADPQGKERLAAKGTSYILNSYVFVPAVDAFGRPAGKAWNRPAAFEEPARTLLAVVCSDKVGVAPGNDHTHSDRWTKWSALCLDVAPGRHGADRGDAMEGGSNYLYADGHVDFIRATELKRLIDSGINPAKPPGWTP